MSNTAAPAHNPAPLYHRIAGALRSDILSGRLLPGSQLPPIAALAATYDVAPVTVREALKLLADEGLTRSRRGSGTFVADAPPVRPRPVLDVNWPSRPDRLRNHMGRILEADDRAPDLMPSDGTEAGAYRRMLRVHTDEAGEAYAVVEIFVDERCYVQAPKRFDKEMVLSVLENLMGPQLPEMHQSFTLAAADARVAEHLNLHPGDPLGRLRRVLLNDAGEIVYYSITLARADRIAFDWVLRRPDSLAAEESSGTYHGYISKTSTKRPPSSATPRAASRASPGKRRKN